MKSFIAVALSTGSILAALVAIMASTGSAFVPAVPHQVGSSTAVPKKFNADDVVLDGFVGLDNPYVQKDESIVPARKCAVCIGVSYVELMSLSISHSSD